MIGSRRFLNLRVNSGLGKHAKRAPAILDTDDCKEQILARPTLHYGERDCASHC